MEHAKLLILIVNQLDANGCSSDCNHY